IIAKVSRDRSITRLNKNYKFGSGYPSDKKSVNFVKKMVAAKKPLPSSVRKSWKPVQKILGLS
ncbi:MAG: ribonuclease HII, partial [Thaumarchaeota archaeon]|nr:ribonuclease HII [Nitrososphaerota archaeon]